MKVQNVESAHWLLADSDKTGKGRDELKELWSRLEEVYRARSTVPASKRLEQQETVSEQREVTGC